MAWCKTDISDFFGWIFVSFKVPEFLHVLFNSVVKHYPLFFWAGPHLFLRKTRTNYQPVHNERNKAEHEHFHLQSFALMIIVFRTRGFFFPFLALLFFLKEKKFTTKKSLRSVLFFSETKCKPAKKYKRIFYY